MTRLAFLASPWVSIGAALVGLAWLAWALVGRKPKHPECLRCRHDLTAPASARCPECGRPVRSTRETTRRRRRPRAVIAASLLLAAGVVGMTQTVPAAWWVPRMPTPALLFVAGRFFDEATTRDIAWELEDRLSLSDGNVAWKLAPHWPAWERAMIEPAIERLELVFAAPGEFRTLRELADCPRPYDDAPPVAAPIEIVLDVSPDELLAEFARVAAGSRDSAGGRNRELIALLQRHHLPLGTPSPDDDSVSTHADLVPIVSGTSDRDRVVRFGVSRFEGTAIWFHRDDDGVWRSAGAACPVPGPDGYRASHDDVVAHRVGDDVLIEARSHPAGGTGFTYHVARLIDARSGRELLQVPRNHTSAAASRFSMMTTAFEWPNAESSLVLDVAVHLEHGVEQATLASADLVLRFERADIAQPFEQRLIRWRSSPPPGVAHPEEMPFIGFGWNTTHTEIASIFGLDPSSLPEW